MSGATDAQTLTQNPISIRQRPDTHAKGIELSTALKAILGQRIRVNHNNSPRWMTGYDGVLLALRDRAVEGDMVACQLLADFMKSAGLIQADGADREVGAAPETPGEKELSDALVVRSRDQIPDAGGQRSPAEPLERRPEGAGK